MYTWEIPRKTQELPGMFQTTTLFIIFSQRQRKNLWVRQNMSFIKVVFILGNDPNFVCMNNHTEFKEWILDGWPSLHHSESSVQFSHSVVSDSTIPWIAARQASLSITNSRSSPKLMSIESVIPSSHLILCRPLLLLSPIPPSIRVFSNESTLRMRWPKYWSFSFSIIPSRNTQDWSPLEWIGW